MKYTACVLSLVTTSEEGSSSVLEVDLSSLAGVVISTHFGETSLWKV